jgi:hypothetical protein
MTRNAAPPSHPTDDPTIASHRDAVSAGEMIDCATAARMVGLQPDTLRKKASAGRIPGAYKIDETTWRFDAAKLTDWKNGFERRPEQWLSTNAIKSGTYASGFKGKKSGEVLEQLLERKP